MKQEKRYFNLRLFFIGFLGVILGMLTFYNLINSIIFNRGIAWLILFLLLFLLTITCIIVCSVKINFRKFLKYCILFVLLFVLGFSLLWISYNKISNLPTYDNECRIVGKVDKYYNQKNYAVIVLDDVKIDNQKIGSQVTLYVISDTPINEDLSLGDEIFATSELTMDSLVTDKLNFEKFVNNNVYSGYVMASSLEIVNMKSSIIQTLQSRLKLVLNKGLNNENADIAYGVIVGDKTELDKDVQESFSYAGISHILAVSGLHVGFLVGMLTFILNLCRVGRKNRFWIISAILILYSIFCGLSPSILRASFMSIILLLAGVLGEEYDGLNALGLAGIIILLLFPLDLFSAGFQLSFMCVFMIITLSDKLSRLIVECKVPDKISSALSTSFCVTLGSSIIVANTMNSVSIISIFSNLIVIPLFGITYPLLFIFSLISMAFPGISIILKAPEFLLHIVKLISNFFAGIDFGHFRIFNLGYLILFAFVIFSIFVKFFMAKMSIKAPICIIIAGIVLICFLVGINPINYKTFALYTNYQHNTNSAVITTKNNKKILIGLDDYSSTSFLLDLKINHLDAVVIPDFQLNKVNDYLTMLDFVKVDEFIIPTNTNYVDFVFDELKNKSNIKIVDNYDYNNINIKFIKDDDGVVCGTNVLVNNKSLLFTNGVAKYKIEALGHALGRVDYIITNSSKYDFADYGIQYDKILHSNYLEFKTNKSISLKNKSYYMLELE